MAAFFVNRPIVAMVISIVMVLLGLVSMAGLPVSLYPDIAPPEIQLQGTYVGADAVTVEESVATPIEQEMSGVDHMIYMYSINAANGQMTLRVDFEVGTAHAGTWNVWLSIANATIPLWSIPVTPTPVTTIPIGFPIGDFGEIGVLTTITTPGDGIICEALETVDTAP